MEPLDKVMKYNVNKAKISRVWLNTSTTYKVLGGITIFWEDESIGFGEISFYLNDKNEWVCDSEHMSKDFVKEVICKMVDGIRID